MCFNRIDRRAPEPSERIRRLVWHMRPNGVAFAGKHAYVCNRNGFVHRYLLEPTPTALQPVTHALEATRDGALDSPEGVCCAGGAVFVCDRPRHCVLAFDGNNLETELLRISGHGMYEPTAIVERDGLLYVGCGCPPQAPAVPGVLVFRRSDGAFVKRIAHPLLREARGLAFVRDHLVVTEYDSRAFSSGRSATRLLCFTPCGELRQVLDEHACPRPPSQGSSWKSLYGCAVVDSGELHVVDTGAAVIRILSAVD